MKKSFSWLYKVKYEPFRGEYYPLVKMAPDPTDIFWENLCIPFKKKIKTKATTWSGTLGILGVGFGLLYGFK